MPFGKRRQKINVMENLGSAKSRTMTNLNGVCLMMDPKRACLYLNTMTVRCPKSCIFRVLAHYVEIH